MAGYGIQNAVSSTIDNSLKIKKLVDLLPTEADRKLEDANRKAEAATLRSDLAEKDAADAKQKLDEANSVVNTRLQRQEALKKSNAPKAVLENEQRLADAGVKSAQQAATKYKNAFQKARALADEAQEAKRAATHAKIYALENSGQRKKSVFERLRGGSK